MADLTVRVTARTRDAENGLGRLVRMVAGVRAAAGAGGRGAFGAAGIASLASIALVAVSQLSGLAVALAQTVLAAIPLPAILASAGIGLLGLGLALKDAKTQLAGLGPEFAKVQQAASAGFWAQAAAPIRALATSVLPTLRAGFGQVGTAWGGLVATMAGSLQQLTAGPGFARLFSETAAAINVARGAVTPLLAGFAALGSVGVAYIVPMAQWFTDLSVRFGAFMQQAAASGQLAQWAQTGLSALSQLGTVVGQVMTLVGTLVRSMAQFGGAASLNPLIAGLTQLNAALAGPIGQNLLATVFGAAQQAMTALGPAFSALGTVLAALVPVLAVTLPTGAMLISTLFQALAPVVTQLAAAITPLIPIIGQSLAGAVQAVAPILAQLAGAVFPVLAQVIAALMPVALQLVQALAGGLMPIVSALMPVFAALVPVIGQVAQVIGIVVAAAAPLIAQLAGQMAPILAEVAGMIVRFAGGILSAAIPALQQILPPVLGAVAVFQGSMIPVIRALLPLVEGTFRNIQAIVTGVLGIVSGLVRTVSAAMRGDWSGAMDGIRQIASSAMTMVQSVISNNIQSVLGFFQRLPGGIGSALSGLPGQLRSVGTNMMEGMLGGISAMAGRIASRAREVVTDAVNAAKAALGIASPSRVFAEIGRFSGLGMVQGLAAMSSRVSAAGANLAQAAVPDAPNLGVPVATGAGLGGASVTINVTGFVGNENELARAIQRAITGQRQSAGLLPMGGAL